MVAWRSIGHPAVKNIVSLMQIQLLPPPAVLSQKMTIFPDFSLSLSEFRSCLFKFLHECFEFSVLALEFLASFYSTQYTGISVLGITLMRKHRVMLKRSPPSKHPS